MNYTNDRLPFVLKSVTSEKKGSSINEAANCSLDLSIPRKSQLKGDLVVQKLQIKNAVLEQVYNSVIG